MNAHMGACSLRISNANEEEKRFIIHGFFMVSSDVVNFVNVQWSAFLFIGKFRLFIGTD